jgi:tetratricopeptide (TPR) repeat protein
VAKDHASVVALTKVAIETAADFPEIDSFVGRSAAELGDLDRALLHLKKATETDSSASPLIQLARVAVQAGDYLEALRAYNAVAADPEAQDWAQTEAERKLVSLLSPAIRACRENIETGRVDYAWELLEQAAQHPQNRERVAKEQERIYRHLRKELKAVDAADVALRFAAAEIVLRIASEDRVALKVGAAAAMRLHRFKEARALWIRFARVAGDDPKIASAIAKCDLWIERASRKKAA